MTVERLRAQIQREQYGKPPILERWIPFTAQMGMWWQYFTWQWLRDPHGAHPVAQMALALLAMMLAITGARVHARSDRSTFVLIAVLTVTLSVALVFYLNFKYGSSQAPELGAGVPREVRDRDYFFLWSFSSLGVWIGLGIADCWRLVAKRLERPRALMYALPVLVIALIPLAMNASTAPRAGQTFTRDFARDMLDSIAPNGVLITNGDNDTFPLWYAQEVEGYRKDVVVMVSSYLGTDWAPWQFLRRGIALAGSAAEADSIPNYMQVATPQQFEAGAIRTTIPKGIITRDQLFVLRMVRDVLPTRPIYFTNSIYPRALGLEPYLVTEGLAVRLMPALPVESNDLVRIGATTIVNVPRSLALWRDTFKGRQAFEAQSEWIDGASLVMPAQYVIAGSILAEALNKRGSSAEAVAVNAQVQRMLGIANLGSVFGRAE